MEKIILRVEYRERRGLDQPPRTAVGTGSVHRTTAFVLYVCEARISSEPQGIYLLDISKTGIRKNRFSPLVHQSQFRPDMYVPFFGKTKFTSENRVHYMAVRPKEERFFTVCAPVRPSLSFFSTAVQTAV